MDIYKGWYLILTKPKQETIAEVNLNQQGFHTYLPLCQQHKQRNKIYKIVTEPLFPRYIFIQLSNSNNWNKIRSTRGCISFVRFSNLPARVPDKLIDELKSKEEALRINNKSSTPDFRTGDHVYISDGILAGYETIIAKKNSDERVTVLLSIAENHTQLFTMSAHQVKLMKTNDSYNLHHFATV